MQMDFECNVCYANDPEVDPAVACQACRFSACTDCIQTYLLSNLSFPHCMKCKQQWTRTQMIKELNIGKAWLDSVYRPFVIKLLEQKELANIPEIQAMIEWIDKRDNDKKSLEEQIKKLTIELNMCSYKLKTVRVKESEQEMAKYTLQFATVSEKIRLLKGKVENLGDGTSKVQMVKSVMNKLLKDGMSAEEVEDIMRNTDMNDIMARLGMTVTNKARQRCRSGECPGWLNGDGFCTICRKNTCLLCFEVKTETHVCKPEDIESANEIKDTSKDCPNCGVSITRISGCDHMFCVSCKNGFNWKTMVKIETVRNTNALAGEFRRLCNDNTVNMDIIIAYIKRLYPNNDDEDELKRTCLNNLLGLVMAWCDSITMPCPVSTKITSNEVVNIKYVKGEINRQQWVRQLYNNYQHAEANQSFDFLFETIRDQALYLLHQVISKPDPVTLLKTLKQLIALQAYANEQLEDIKNTFNRHFEYKFKFISDTVDELLNL